MKAVADFFDGLENADNNQSYPLVTLSYAQSLDGSITHTRGLPLGISGPESLRFTHFLRSIHDGILVGVGTIQSDDPRLTVREVQGPNPQPVILDPDLRIPKNSRIFNQPKPPWIFTAARRQFSMKSLVEEKGGRIFNIQRNPSGIFDLESVLGILKEEGITRLMVEGGARVIEYFIRANLVDAAVITIAPSFVGGLKPIRNPLINSSKIADFPRIENPFSKILGNDILIWGKMDKQIR